MRPMGVSEFRFSGFPNNNKPTIARIYSPQDEGVFGQW